MGEPQTEEAVKLLDYWRALPRDGLVPGKSDLNPARILPLLPHIVMLELESREMFRLTLVGTEHGIRCGEEMTGGNYLDRVNPATKSHTVERMWQTIAHPVGSLYTYDEVARSGRRARIESLHLPLADEAGRPRYIVALAKEMNAEGYELNPLSEHTYTAKVVSHRYLDIGAGVPDPTAAATGAD